MARTTFTGPLVIGRAQSNTSEEVNGEIIIHASAATGLFVDNNAQAADIIITMPATPGVGDTIQLKNITQNSNGFTFNEYVFFEGAGGIEGVVSGASGTGGASYSKGTPIPRGFGTTAGQYIYSGSTYGWVRV